MQKFFLFLFLAISLFSCKQSNIVSEKEVLGFLTAKPNEQLKHIETEISFWSNRFDKIRDDIASQLKLGSLYNKRFQYTGNIKDVLKSDSFYLQAHKLQKQFSSSTYRSLATNCITQHQFKQAAAYLDTASTLGDDKYFTLLQQFDVAIELGNYLQASSILKEFRYKNTFEYYIRYSKLQDHLGNSNESIAQMEKAVVKAEETKNEHLILWAKSNMADMYGHQQQIKKAYQLYLETLKTDPNYYHALKGIAWIAFSHDKNTTLAKTILNHLKKVHPVPDYNYLLAEIATFENNQQEKEFYTNQFLTAVKNPAYGDMYNKYVFNIMSDEVNNYSEALRIAQLEVNNRPTPESFDLLAWAFFKNKQQADAIEIAEKKLIKRNFEPDAIYHLGVLYKQNGNTKLAKLYLNQALESSFELGPVITKEIKEQLSAL